MPNSFAIYSCLRGVIQHSHQINNSPNCTPPLHQSSFPLEAANTYLKQRWIRRYNRRFRKAPRSQDSAYRSRRDIAIRLFGAGQRPGDFIENSHALVHLVLAQVGRRAETQGLAAEVGDNAGGREGGV